MRTYKLVGWTLGSALIGAAIMIGVFKWAPKLIVVENAEPSISEEIDLNDDPESEVKTEQDMFEKFSEYGKRLDNDLDSYFDNDLFLREDPFQSMREFRDKVEGEFKELHTDRFVKSFDSWFGRRFGGGSAQDIEKREDKDNIYYDVKVEDVKSTSIKSKVEDGHISIEGKTDKKFVKDTDDDIINESTYVSTFVRTFPVPRYVDTDKLKVEYNKKENRITLSFPKIK